MENNEEKKESIDLGGINTPPLDYQFGLPSNEQIGHMGELSTVKAPEAPAPPSPESLSSPESSASPISSPSPTSASANSPTSTPLPTSSPSQPFTPKPTPTPTSSSSQTSNQSFSGTPTLSTNSSPTIVPESTTDRASAPDNDAKKGSSKRRQWSSANEKEILKQELIEEVFDGVSSKSESWAESDDGAQFKSTYAAPTNFDNYLKKTDHYSQNLAQKYADNKLRSDIAANGDLIRKIIPLFQFTVFLIIAGSAVSSFLKMVSHPRSPELDKSPLPADFKAAKQNKDWPQARRKMQEAIDAAIAKKTTGPFLVAEYQAFGHQLFEHQEYKPAIDVLTRGLELPGINDKWKVFLTLERGNNEQHYHRQHQGYLPNRQAVIDAIALSQKIGEKYREAQLISLLGQLDYNDGNTADGDMNFAKAERIFADMTEFDHDHAQRQVIEHWWESRMHRTLSMKLPKVKPLVTTLSQSHSDVDLASKVTPLLNTENFPELTKLFEQLEKHREQSYSGGEAIQDLYDAVTELGENSPESDWLQRKALIQKWSKVVPNSPIPHLVMAEFDTNYAWNARGDSYASGVKTSSWITYRKRLMDGQVELDAALDYKTIPPEWFSIAQTNYLGSTTGKTQRPDYEKMVATGTGAYPDYVPIYLQKTYYLQPRWHGAKGEFEKYVDAQSAKLAGDEADKMYFRLINFNSGLYKDIYAEFPALSKARALKGQSLLNRDFGIK